MNILSWITHSPVVPILYKCVCWVEHRERYFDASDLILNALPLTTTVGQITMIVNSAPGHSSKYIQNKKKKCHFSNYGSQRSPRTVWSHSFKYLCLCLSRIQTWNNANVSKWGQNFSLTIKGMKSRLSVTFEKHFIILCIVLTAVWHPKWFNMCSHTGTQTIQIIEIDTKTKRPLKILIGVWIQDEDPAQKMCLRAFTH